MSNAEEVTVQIELRPEDVYDPFHYSWGNLSRLVFALLLGYILYTTRETWAPDGSKLAPAAGILTLLVSFGLVLLIVFLYPYLRVRSLFHDTPTLRKPRNLSFNAEGIRINSEDAQGNYTWSVFRYIIETRKAFSFAQTTRSASGLVVPKRCLSGGDDIKAMRRLVRANYSGRAWLRSD
jgi:hypothetical protein